jgi:hypothetical protein
MQPRALAPLALLALPLPALACTPIDGTVILAVAAGTLYLPGLAVLSQAILGGLSAYSERAAVWAVRLGRANVAVGSLVCLLAAWALLTGGFPGLFILGAPLLVAGLLGLRHASRRPAPAAP